MTWRFISPTPLLAIIIALATVPAAAADPPGGARPLAKLSGPTGTDVAFSRDGKRLLTAGGGEARVWDAETARPVIPPVKHPAGARIGSAAWSPDAKTFLTTAGDEVRVWDATNGNQITMLRHDGPVRRAVFGHDGSRVVSASDDKTARVWDARSGEELLALKHPTPVRCAGFSPDGSAVVTVRLETTPRILEYVPWRGVAHLWDATRGQEIPLGEEGGCPVNVPGGRSVRPVAFAPGSRTVAIVFASLIALHDSRSGKLTGLLHVAEVEGTFKSAEYSPDGHRIVAVTGNGFVNVWDVEGEHLVCPKFGEDVEDARFAAEGKLVVTFGPGAASGVWDAATGVRRLALPEDSPLATPEVALSPDGTRLTAAYPRSDETLLRELTVPPAERPAAAGRARWRQAGTLRGTAGAAASFSGDGSRLLTAGADGARVWDARTRSPLTGRLPHGATIVSAAISPDGARAMTVGGRRVRLWHVDPDAVADAPPLCSIDHAGVVRSAALSGDGKRVVTAAQGEKTVHVRDASDGKVLVSLKHESPAYFARFSPDSTRVLTLMTGRAVLWDASTGRELLRRPVDDSGADEGDSWVRGVAFSPDGKKAATRQFRGVVVWSTADGERLAAMDTIDAGSGTFDIVFSPDSSRLATLDATCVNLWDASNGELLLKIPKFGVQQAYFAADGQSLLTAGQVGATGLWDLSTAQRILAIEASEPTDDPAVAISPDGTRIAAGFGSEDFTGIWEVPDRKEP